MKNCKIFALNSHPALAAEISRILKMPLGKITLKKFSCGENFVNFEETVRGREIFLIGTARTEFVNEDFFEVFLAADAAKRSFAKKVHIVFPHFGYARQDKIHCARESISAKLIAKLLQNSGVDHLICLHLHTDQIQGFFDFTVDNLSARRLFVEKLKKEKIENPVIVSPDAGGAKSAKKFADELGANLAILHKSRPAHNTAEIFEIVGDVKNRNCILLDDLIDTAGSVCAAKEILIKNGARKNVFLAATHPVFSGAARKKLAGAKFAKIFVSDSLPLENCKNLPIETVSVAPLISQTIENVLSDRSVSQLFF